MIYKIHRLYYTLIDLRFIQIINQVIKVFVSQNIFIAGYYKYLQKKVFKLNVDSILYVQENSKIESNFSFEFLNKRLNFKEEIDWNYNLYGKLWNYNLQYLDYILYDNITLEYRKELIKSFSKSILKKQIKLEPYPVSLRINNIIIFDSIYGIEDRDVYDALIIQVYFLSKNLEYHLLGNHLLENYISLLVASYALRDRKLFVKFSLLLKKELDEQILNDGGHFERSPMYHSIILQRLMMCIDIMNKNEIFCNTELKNCLLFNVNRMMGWLNEISFSNGTWAHLNDSTNGICLTKHKLDKIAGILGIHGVKINLRESGFRKFKSQTFELIVNTGGITPKYQPGHAHSDILSFYLSDGNVQLIVDTGVSTYEGGPIRDNERSTMSHNTIAINDKNQSDIWGTFRVGKKAEVEIIIDELNRLKSKVYNLNGLRKSSHQREIILYDEKLLIKDNVNSKSNDFKNYIHFDFKIKPIQDGNIVYFENYKLEYTKGLIEMQIEPYKQALGFNLRELAFKVVSKVEKDSEFIISKIK